jgi:hypothetical protein
MARPLHAISPRQLLGQTVHVVWVSDTGQTVQHDVTTDSSSRYTDSLGADDQYWMVYAVWDGNLLYQGAISSGCRTQIYVPPH